MDWTAGDVSGSDTLTTSDHLFASYFNELRSAFNTTVLTVATSQSGITAHYICNSNTNDQNTTTQTIINNALTALSAAGGGRLVLRRGTYYVKTPGIAVPSNCILEGEGWGTIIYRSTGSAFTGTIHNLDKTAGTNTGIVIRNLMINGNRAGSGNPGGNQDDVLLTGVTDSLVDRVYVYDSADSAIVLDYNANYFTNNCVVRNCIIDTTEDIGIYNSNPNSCIIQNNIVRNTASYGIRVIRRTANGAEAMQILGNRIYNCGQTNSVEGLIVDQADTTQVVGNYVRAAGKNGMLFVNAAYLNVSNNFILESDLHGIYFNGSSRSSCTGNTIHNSSRQTTGTYSGIDLNDSSDITVTGNRSGDSGSGTRQKYGINEEGTSDTNVFLGNMLDRNGTSGLNKIGASSIGDNTNNRV